MFAVPPCLARGAGHIRAPRPRRADRIDAELPLEQRREMNDQWDFVIAGTRRGTSTSGGPPPATNDTRHSQSP